LDLYVKLWSTKGLGSHEHGITIIFTRSNSPNSAQCPNIYSLTNAVLETPENCYLTLKASIQQEQRWEKKQYTIWVTEVISSARYRPQCPASPHCLFATYFKQVSLSVQGMLLYVHRLGVNHGVQQKLLGLLSIALS
jgi:hypothetical protein